MLVIKHIITATIRNISAKTTDNTLILVCIRPFSSFKPILGINVRASVAAVVIPIAVALSADEHHDQIRIPISAAKAKAMIVNIKFIFILLNVYWWGR